MYVSWVLADKLRIVMSSIMRWRRGEIGFVIGELLSLDCTNVQSLQTGDCLPMPSLRSSRPIGHDHYRNVRQSDRQIQHSQLAIGLQTFATGSLPRSGLVQRVLRNIEREFLGLFRLGARELDDLGPLLGVFGDELCKVGGRARKRSAAQVGKPRLDLGVSETRIDLLVELVDDLG